MSGLLVHPGARASSDSDVELLGRVARKDLGALGELYDRHARDVWRVARRMLGASNDAEDVVHAVFMKLPEIAGSHDGRANVRSWLLGVTVRIAARQRRGAGRFLKMVASFAKSVSNGASPNPEREAGAREELHVLEAALAALSDKKRDAYTLIEIEGLTSDEAAAALGIPAATVRTRLHHARRDLAEALTKLDPKRGGEDA